VMIAYSGRCSRHTERSNCRALLPRHRR